MKGITSNQVPSQCVLQSYTSGNTQLVNRTEAQTLPQFSAQFISNIDEDKGCNFAAYVPLEEDTPLQVLSPSGTCPIIYIPKTYVLSLQWLSPEG